MSDHTGCKLITLAKSDGNTVDYCEGCQAFHVNLGGISLHLNAEGLHCIGGLINRAQWQLKELQAPKPHRSTAKRAADAEELIVH